MTVRSVTHLLYGMFAGCIMYTRHTLTHTNSLVLNSIITHCRGDRGDTYIYLIKAANADLKLTVLTQKVSKISVYKMRGKKSEWEDTQ